VLIEETRSLAPSVCTEVEARIRPDAQTTAPGPLRRKVRALILAVDAEQAARRAAAAATQRQVTFRPVEDSQMLLIAKGPAVQLQALARQLDEEAKALIAGGDPRTMDQLRFDLLSAHQTGALHAKPLRALIQVPVATALGLSDEPGVLEGYGPLPAPLVRELLTTAELRKVCLDQGAGRVVGTEHRVLPPTGSAEELRRALLRMVQVDQLREPATTIGTLPPRQALRLDRHGRPRRHQPLDQPRRPDLHRPHPRPTTTTDSSRHRTTHPGASGRPRPTTPAPILRHLRPSRLRPRPQPQAGPNPPRRGDQDRRTVGA
jgi:hypothetical protein